MNRDPSERRIETDRRQSVVDRRVGLDRRRGPGRRLSEDRRSAEEGRMSDEQFEFLMAIEEYKRLNAKPFPSWTEVLDVIKALGYSKPGLPSDATHQPAKVATSPEDSTASVAPSSR
jgi:hypothetical protein